MDAWLLFLLGIREGGDTFCSLLQIENVRYIGSKINNVKYMLRYLDTKRIYNIHKDYMYLNMLKLNKCYTMLLIVSEKILTTRHM